MISAPRDQLTCNACTAFAISATLEAAIAIAGRAPTVIDPGFIHACVAHQGTNTDPQSDCLNGADIDVTLYRLKARGCVAETEASVYPCPTGRCGEVGLQLLHDYKEIPTAVAAATAITTTGPLVGEMWIWNNFFDYRGKTPTYNPDPGSGGQMLHSVCIIGFDASGWIIKNSHGPNWGDGGFGTIAYGSCGLFAAPPPEIRFPCQVFSIQLAPLPTENRIS